MDLDRDTIKKQLRDEGFNTVFVWSDAPGAQYPEHTHPGETAHVVLDGEITIHDANGTQTYRTGDRFDVPPDAAHSASVGPQGCTFVVGE